MYSGYVAMHHVNSDARRLISSPVKTELQLATLRRFGDCLLHTHASSPPVGLRA